MGHRLTLALFTEGLHNTGPPNSPWRHLQEQKRVWMPWHFLGWCGRSPCGSFPLVHNSQSRQVQTGRRRCPGWGAGVATQSDCDPSSPSAPRGTKVPGAASAGVWEAGGEISLTAHQHLLAAPGPPWIQCPGYEAAPVGKSWGRLSAPAPGEGLRKLAKQQLRNKPGRAGSCAPSCSDPCRRHAHWPQAPGEGLRGEGCSPSAIILSGPV